MKLKTLVKSPGDDRLGLLVISHSRGRKSETCSSCKCRNKIQMPSFIFSPAVIGRLSIFMSVTWWISLVHESDQYSYSMCFCSVTTRNNRAGSCFLHSHSLLSLVSHSKYLSPALKLFPHRPHHCIISLNLLMFHICPSFSESKNHETGKQRKIILLHQGIKFSLELHSLFLWLLISQKQFPVLKRNQAAYVKILESKNFLN